jgi:hypothetical protein
MALHDAEENHGQVVAALCGSPYSHSIVPGGLEVMS